MKVKYLIKDSDWIYSSKYKHLNPDVTVILPTYRRLYGGFFERCVESIISQTFINFELIIIDDFSTDGTFEKIKEYIKEDARISCIRHHLNIGLPAISVYEGFCRSRGKYISYIFDDGEYTVNALETLVNKSKIYKKDVVCGNGIIYTKNGDKIYLGSLAIKQHNLSISSLYTTNFLSNGSFLISKKVFNDIGHFDPHATLIRLNDWDLWQRIIKKYDIHLIDDIIFFEKELNDSLGNSFDLEMRLAKIRMLEDRTEILSTKNFVECDVIKLQGLKDEIFQNYYEGYLEENFGARRWYKKNNKKESYSDGIIFCRGIDPSTELCFDRSRPRNFNMTLFHHHEMRFIDFLLFTGFAIVIPDLTNDHLYDYDIPTYYFVDDAFLGSTKNRDDYSIEFIKNELKHYEGVLISTPALLEYYKKNKLHDNCYLFPAIFRNDIYRHAHQEDKITTICFQGSQWSCKYIKELIIDILKSLESIKNMRFVCPDFLAKELRDSIDNIEIISIESTLDYCKFIQNISRYSIDITIHPYADSQNNKFKEINALINATLLNSVLITSNNLPYKNIQNGCCILVEDTINSWKNAILKIHNDYALKNNIIKNAYEYCIKFYSGDLNEHVLTELSRKHRTPSLYEYKKRVSKYVNKQENKIVNIKKTPLVKLFLHIDKHGYLKTLIATIKYIFVNLKKYKYFHIQ